VSGVSAHARSGVDRVGRPRPVLVAGYQLESLAYSAGVGGWVGVWLDAPLRLQRHPGVTLHARTRDQVRDLAAARGLPWPQTAAGPDGGAGG